MVLVDTTIWSLALRRRASILRRNERELVEDWTTLVTSGSAALIGPIHQEILSGIRSAEVFVKIRQRLADFSHLIIDSEDYSEAARFFNVCRSHGVAGTSIDMLICAVAHRYDVPIFTTDRDFTRYVTWLPVRLYKPE
jgi:predicted nucleic acid-binding protein